MTTTLESLRTLLGRVADAGRAEGRPVYLVGGLLRDAVLGRPLPSPARVNVDVAVPSEALAFARRLADRLGGTYICLDESQPTARIVFTSSSGRVELDCAEFRGRTIEEDLSRRDFTVNAFAVVLERWCRDPHWAAHLLDPLGGRRDAERGLLRACFPKTFEDDPVRILRAFRFAAGLGWHLDPAMLPLISAVAPRLAGVSGERVRDELLAIFQTDAAAPALRSLEQLGVLGRLFPELAPGRGLDQGTYHHLDVLGHELETVAQGDRMLRDFAEFSEELRAPMAAYCAVEPVEGRSRKALIKLAGLFHDVGKPATKRVKPDGDIWFLGHEHFGAELVGAPLERLRLANRETAMVEQLVRSHLRPGHLSREVQLTARAVFRFFRDLGEDGPACLLVWWADRMATRGPSSNVDQIDQQRARLEELLRAYFLKPEEAVAPPKLLDGRQLMQALGLPPGPVIGRLLQAVQEAQAEGRVAGVEDALRVAREELERTR
ncbi:MAG: HD domain-containing protein [Candidatus Omnitrophica bacterium]|nr:HD domain-containing protein [Candidatus Omnitrophota bacterium]